MKNKGFTLAEVLIALGIIGVVAAMTIPSLINKYKELVTVNKVKKFYSMMNQALLLSINDFGYVDEWGASNSVNIANNLKAHLKVVKDCKGNSGCIAAKYTWTEGYDIDSRYYKMILSDGSYLWLRNNYRDDCSLGDTNMSTGVCGLLWFDLNGKQEPNDVGKDVFVFYILKNRIIPHQGICNNTSYWGCANYILQNGNMDYLKN